MQTEHLAYDFYLLFELTSAAQDVDEEVDVAREPEGKTARSILHLYNYTSRETVTGENVVAVS